MSDARALLRAKRQESEAHIVHPYAAYNSAGQLRCFACGVPVKSAAMWEGHVGSKAHRVVVRKMKAKEEEERERQLKRMGKRKAEEGVDMDVDAEENATSAKKRRTSDEPDGAHTNSYQQPTNASGFPADFFSDPSQAPVISAADEEEEEGNASAQTAATADKTKSQIDLEWEQFQASLLTQSAATEEQEDDRRAAFERATVAAEAELAPSGAEGFPPAVVADANGVEEKKEETEEEKRRRKEQDERELIMDRLVEEERAQEEADERVGLLKARVEALKRAREAKRKAK